MLGKSTLRGMTALFVGLAMGLVGLDQITGQARYTGGVPELLDGIEVVLVAVGLFAVAEALYAVLYEGRTVETQNTHEQGAHDARASGAARGRPGCAAPSIGFPFGTHPGRRQRDPDLPELRHREEAVASTRRSSAPPVRSKAWPGPEAANNAAITATLIPLLTLGIPTSNTTAILLGAFQNYGIQPGPQLFDRTRPRWCGR